MATLSGEHIEPDNEFRLTITCFRFQAVTAQGKKKDRIELTILVSANASRGIEFASLQSLFKNIGKQKKNPYTVNRKVEPVIVQTS